MAAIPVAAADSIADCFEKRVAATPDKAAYRFFDAQSSVWKEHTWRQAHERVQQMRAALEREKLAVGERVAIMAKNGPDWVFFDQAAQALGLVVVPLFVDDRPDNVAYCLNDSGTRVIMVQGAEQCAKLSEVSERIPGVQRIVCSTAKPIPCEARMVNMRRGGWTPWATRSRRRRSR